MYFQKIVKGINGLDRTVVEFMINEGGIVSNWWREVGKITPAERRQRLTERELIAHLNDYDDPLPAWHPHYNANDPERTVGDYTPYISTSAGSVQRDDFARRNILFDPFFTALEFATDYFTSPGWVFYAYVFTLGKKSIPLEQFSEEVRELHIYSQYLPFHREGEVTAKIIIPSVQIEKAEYYDPPLMDEYPTQEDFFTPVEIIENKGYAHPDDFHNIRELL